MSYPEARYFGPAGERSATYRSADDGPDLEIGGHVTVRYLATGASTDGRFGLYRWDSGPHSGGAAPHFHRTMSESFFVISGRVELYDGERWIDAGPGDFVHVPEGGVHGFRNQTAEPASMLILFAPGAPREGYFEAIAGKAAGRPYSDAEWTALCEHHDNYFVD
ncbi:MAG TPA: cupin domain-containing protein [Acidimicrobiia bacterium]|nr:cupin domain-containing protein [Acidimicrobiia bacterium]